MASVDWDRDGDSSPWTRTRVQILLDLDSESYTSGLGLDSRHVDSTRTSGLGPDFANFAAELDSIYKFTKPATLKTSKRNGDKPTIDSIP